MKVTQKDLAEVLRVERRSIQNWQKQPGFPLPEKAGQRKLYDLQAVMDWYRDRQQREYEEKTEHIDEKAQSARLKRAQADKAEMHLQAERKRLIPVDVVKDVFFGMNRAAKEAFQSQSRKSAKRLVGVKSEREATAVLEQIYAEFHEAYSSRYQEFIEEYQRADRQQLEEAS